jgi:hypothetical protein
VNGYALNAIYGIKLSNSENQWHAFDYVADKMLSERRAVYCRKYHAREAWTEKKMTKQQIHSGERGPF